METQSFKDFLARLRESTKRAYEEDIAAIDRVIRLADEQQPQVSSIVETHQLAEQPTMGASIIGSVEELFRADPHKAWNVRTLHRKLAAAGFPFQAKNPKASLNTALLRLEKRRVIHAVERGSGRRPTIYKLLPFAQGNRMNGDRMEV
jgi:hypothetical protein